MNQSMRKIIYYENILEFKENTKEQINLSEVNNWQLCRTCLMDTCKEDADLEKINIMDVMQGTFLSIKEMLVQTTDLKMSVTEKLPIKVCKECFGKITALYYFSIQVRKADKILKRLVSEINELGESENDVIQKDIPDKSTSINETVDQEFTVCKLDENMFNENALPDDSMLIEVEELFDYTEDLEKIDDMTNSSEVQNEAYEENFKKDVDNIVNDTVYFEEISETDAELLTDKEIEIERSINSDEDSNLQEDLLEISVNNEEDHISDLLQNKVNTLKRKRVKNLEPPISGFKHKQPRVTSPLLHDSTCAICKKTFERQHDLVQHVRSLHPNSKAYKCRVCSKPFSHIQSLSRHMNTHKSKLVLNECEYCAKTFLRVDDLRRHLRIHTGERPYACSLCDKSYQQMSELKEHEKKHFGTQSHKCFECGQSYLSRNGLYIHKKKYHKQKNDNDEGPFICSLCEKSFESKSELKSHEKKHFLAQSIRCTECHQTFKTRNSFCMHRKKCHKYVTERKSNSGIKKELNDILDIVE